jgi:hypothetical protein
MKSFTRRRAQRAVGVAGLAAATLLAFGSFAQAEPDGKTKGPALPNAFETPILTGTLTPNTDPRDVAVLEGLPAGRYQFTSTMTASAIGANPFFFCDLRQNGNATELPFVSMSERFAGQPDPGQGFAASSSMTALVTVEDGDRIAAHCFGTGTYLTKLVAVAVAPAASPSP